MTLFEFIIDGPPVSQQTRRRARLHAWKEEVRREAEKYWSVGKPPITDKVKLAITYFYDGVSMDVDNIPKPISDALNGLVYEDDIQVTDSSCCKRDLNDDLVVKNLSSILAEGFSRGREFLYIVIEDAPDQRLIK